MFELNRKGQGTTEYIVIIGIVVVIALVILKTSLGTSITSGLTNIGNKVQQATQ